MIFTKDLAKDDKYPLSCVYWIYHEDKHSDPRFHGYVGVCVKGAHHRFNRHKSEAKLGSHYLVHKALRKYGDKIKCKVLIESDPELCLLAEAMLRPMAQQPGTWNLGAGGETPGMGYVPTEETRKKLSLASTGRKFTDEQRARMSASQRGRKATDEAKKNMSLASKGKPKNLSDEQRAHKSRLMKERKIWDNPETRQKISDALKGRPLSENHRESISLATRGKPKTNTHANKISKALSGKKKSENHVKAMSASQKSLHEDIGGWENYRANKRAWSLAIDVFNLLSENPEISTGQIQRSLGLEKRSYVVTIHRDITKSNWNPSEDAAYMSWLSEYKLKKEAENV